jgi:3',5'-cyclic-AMP phosphodiesterase
VTTIAHISDPHVGSPYFVPNLMNRVIKELNELAPDVIVVSGDLTSEGFRPEYKAWLAYVERLEAPVLTVPGNHDSRNVGYLHFEDLIGPRMWTVDVQDVRVVGVDSSEPDLNEGKVGRVHYPWIKQEFRAASTLNIFVLHHHLLPIPGTGRERNIVYDAGDLLEVLLRSRVKLVLAGHKHVPYAWHLENLFVVTTGTVSTLRLRGHGRPCYNVIEVGAEWVRIYRKYPFEGQEPIIEFSRATHEYEKHGLGAAI